MMEHAGDESVVARAVTTLVVALAVVLAPAIASAQAVQGVTDKEVLFGMTAAFSGNTKELGRHSKTGWELAFAAANEAGGVNGRKLKLIAMHDDNEPKMAAQVAKELVEKKKIFAMVGSVGSVTTDAYLNYLLDRQMLLFCPLSGADHLRNDPPDRYVFNCRASGAEEVMSAMRYLVEVRRVKPSQIAVLLQRDKFGESGYRGFAYQMRRYRRDPATTVRTSYQRNTVDVDDAVKTIRANAKHLRAVITVGNYRPIAKFIEKTRDLDLIYTSTSEVGAETLADLLLQLGAKYTENIVVTQPGPPPSSRATAVLKYQQLLKRYAPGERLDFLSLQSYLAGVVLVESLKRAGRDLNSETLVDAIESLKGYDLGVGVPVAFGPSEHQAWHKIWGTMLQTDGSWKTIELE
jgi:ABC-type branched-subunit amino acid transport system substrate-binding protein